MRRPRSDVARNRRLLVQAAIESFHDDGWNVPLDTVARRAGVGNATLYRHFPTREDLYEAAFAEIHERIAAVLERHRDAEDAWRALHDLVFEIYSTLPVGPTTGRVAEERLDTSPSLRSTVAEVRAALDRVLRLAQRQGSARPDVDVDDVMLLMDGLVPVVGVSAEVAPQFWQRHLVLVLDALRAAGATPLPARAGDPDQLGRLARAARHC